MRLTKRFHPIRLLATVVMLLAVGGVVLATPVLLIHGTADAKIPPGQSRELRAVPRRGETELWEVPGAAHVSAISAEPSEMPRRVVDWFRRH
jgi:dipeptidyl aminopeptidase/acylaminoacyl peptidase